MSLLQACGNDVNNDLQSQQFPSSVSGSLEHQNNQRVYNLHIPPAYDGLTDLPLVIMLHGGSGNAKSVQGFTQMNPVADANGFMIAYPQGFAPAGQNGFSWADGRETSATLMGIDDVGFILKLVEKLISNYRINSNKVYVAGFSNGGFMSQKLACELEDVFAGVGTLGATIDSDVLSKCTTSQSIPMLLMLGDADPFVPYNGGTVANNPSPIAGIETLANFWKENNNCSTTKPETQLPDVNSRDNSTVSLFQFSDCACDADVSLYRINGGGHTWPGVENVSYEMIAGETNKDINASTVLWEFFDEHERCI
ncbi:MAG: prolyl oligopeptidase family serine peptidase [Bacteroidetes bacterium]|nr:prolyl oligopeptidase family serine peptidase [Bacteroidota bacterium]